MAQFTIVIPKERNVRLTSNNGDFKIAGNVP